MAFESRGRGPVESGNCDFSSQFLIRLVRQLPREVTVRRSCLSHDAFSFGNSRSLSLSLGPSMDGHWMFFCALLLIPSNKWLTQWSPPFPPRVVFLVGAEVVAPFHVAFHMFRACQTGRNSRRQPRFPNWRLWGSLGSIAVDEGMYAPCFLLLA